MAGLHDQRLRIGHDLQVFFDQPQLHPVLTDAAGFAISDQLVRVEGDIEIEVVVDHQLKGFTRKAAPLVSIDGLGLERPVRTETVAIYAATGPQLLEKLRNQPLMMMLGNIAQRILQSGFGLAAAQAEAPVRGAPDLGRKSSCSGSSSSSLTRMAPAMSALLHMASSSCSGSAHRLRLIVLNWTGPTCIYNFHYRSSLCLSRIIIIYNI
jgi:hypothetical protein